MPYTPPGGGSISVDLGDPAYTPPSGGAISVDLGAEDGGGSTQSNAVGTANITITVPADIVARASKSSLIDVTANVVIDAPAPSGYAVTRTDVVPSISVSVGVPVPTFLSVKTSSVDATGDIVVAGVPPVSFFKGKTTQITSTGNVTVTVPEPASKTHTQKLTVTGQVIIGVPVPRFVWGTQLSVSGQVTITGHADITQRFSVRKGILGKYSYPSLTLTDYGNIVITVPAGITQKIRLHSYIEGVYGFFQTVGACVDSSYNYRVAASLSASYSLRGPVGSYVSSAYDVSLVDTVRAAVLAGYRMPIAAGLVSSYSLTSPAQVRAAAVGVYTIVQPVKVGAYVTDKYTLVQHLPVGSSVVSRYSLTSPTTVRWPIVSSYTYQLRASAGVVGEYNLTSPLRKGITLLYTSMVNNEVRRSVSGVYTSQTYGPILINSGPYAMVNNEVRRSVSGVYTSQTYGPILINSGRDAMVNGVAVSIENVQVSIAEGEFMWKCSMVLTHIADYAVFIKDLPFQVVMGGEVFEFIVDTKELSRRSPANLTAVISGLSPSAIYTEPRSAILDQSWDIAVMAGDAARSLIPGLDWQVIDWLIPEYRLAASGTSPYSVVSVIAAAIGATVESGIDGSVYVRSLHPVSVADYYTVIPEHTLLETDDIFSVSETYPSDSIYNRLIISDIEDSINDRLEWIPAYEGAWVGVVRAYLYPWRTGVWLTHTGRATNFILPPAVVLEEHTEVIEIFQGKGSAQYPIFNIVSVEYEANNVGALTVSPDASDFTVSAANPNTVIRLVYQSRSLDYPVGIVEGAPTQFLLNSPPL
jgi:hypothetical protein